MENKKERKVMPTVYFMIGLPGSGKSTFIEKIRQEKPDLPVVSTDNEITMLAKKYGITYNEAMSDKHGITDEQGKTLDFYSLGNNKFKKNLREILSEKKSFIWDQTNIVKSARTSKIIRLRSENYNVVVLFMDIAFDEWEKRLNHRNITQPEKFFSEKLKQEFVKVFTPPDYSEGMHSMYFIKKDGNIEKIDKITLEKKSNAVSINNIMNM